MHIPIGWKGTPPLIICLYILLYETIKLKKDIFRSCVCLMCFFFGLSSLFYLYFFDLLSQNVTLSFDTVNSRWFSFEMLKYTSAQHISLSSVKNERAAVYLSSDTHTLSAAPFILCKIHSQNTETDV